MLNIIVNPNALMGRGGKLLKKAEKKLGEAGAEYRIWHSDKKGAITGFARTLSEAGETDIVAFGGDGTLNEVLSGIQPEKVRLGLIPAGTGNDFACAANIPIGVGAIDLILNREPVYTDFLEFDDGRRSMNIAGIGMDVDILKRKEKRGGTYFGAFLASLFRYRGTDISVTVNGETKEYHAMIAAMCNGKNLGGGIPLCPPADIEDGLMELLVIDCPKRSKLLGELIRLMRKKLLTRPIAHRFSCEEAQIVLKERGSAQYDGEIKPCERLAGRIVSGKLRMYRG